MNTQNKYNDKVIQTGLNRLEDIQEGTDASELHHYLYNEDYFIIGTYDAKQFLEKEGVFDVIEKIREYEQGNFGAVSNDFSNPEKVANMFAYIQGEEILGECGTLQEKRNEPLGQEDLDAIKEEMESLQS